jgi:MFS family permease
VGVQQAKRLRRPVEAMTDGGQDRTDDERTGLLSSRIDSRSSYKWISFLLCLLCCLSASSITIFSVYTTEFQRILGYSQLQINAISIAAEIGMYFPVPLLGYAGDKHGQSKLALLSSGLFTPAYLMAAYVYNTHGSYKLLAGCFATIGMATSALYVSALVTCARMYPGSSGLAISAPVAMFGVSSLWQSQMIPSLFGGHEGLNVANAFIFFSVLYLVTGLVAYVAAKLADVDGSDSKLATEGEEEEMSQRERLVEFLSGHDTWILMLAFVLTSGPLEMYLNNIGAILSTIGPGKPLASNHVSLFSALSTVARLSVGVISDIVRPRVSTAMVLATILFATGVAHFLLAMGVFTAGEGSLFYIFSMINGFSYGALFTLYPTMVACVWGLKSFGTNWGLFILGPAMGSVIYGVIFASVYESASSDMSCLGPKCYEATFLITGTGIIISSFLVFGLWQYSWKRNTLITL